jgi:hypothetical protein
METMEAVSSPWVEKCAEKHKSQPSVPFAKAYRGRIGKKIEKRLANRRNRMKITKRPPPVVGQNPNGKSRITHHQHIKIQRIIL